MLAEEKKYKLPPEVRRYFQEQKRLRAARRKALEVAEGTDSRKEAVPTASKPPMKEVCKYEGRKTTA